MLGSCFDWSPYKAIDNAYPGRFHKWQFNVKGMWQGPDRFKLAAEATRWMIEEVEGVPVDEIPQRISATTFGKYNLRGMLSVCFRGSFFRAIENAYPEPLPSRGSSGTYRRTSGRASRASRTPDGRRAGSVRRSWASRGSASSRT